MNSAVAAAALLVSLALLCVRRRGTLLWLCGAQALLAAVALGLEGSAVAVVAFALNGIAMPWALRRVAHRGPRRIEERLGIIWPAAVALMLIAIVSFARFGTAQVISAGASITLLGLVLTLRGTPALALLSSQNGLVLVASATPALPQWTVLLAAVPLVPAMLLAHGWLRA